MMSYDEVYDVYIEGDWDRVIALAKEALVINPNAYEYLVLLGRTYAKLYQDQQAISCYNQAIEICPENADAYGNMAWSYQSLGNLTEAIRCWVKSHELYPSLSSLYAIEKTVNELLRLQFPTQPRGNGWTLD